MNPSRSARPNHAELRSFIGLAFLPIPRAQAYSKRFQAWASTVTRVPCLVRRMVSTRPAAISADSDKNRIPEMKECVRLTKSPIILGPTKPPRLPIELIIPMHAAAAVPERKLVGKDQKHGM